MATQVVYELRPWSENAHCLYTDDSRVRDAANRSPDLQIVGTYFRTPREVQPFAWDVVGSRDRLTGLTKELGSSARPA